MVADAVMLAVLGLSGGELILVLGAVLILFGAKRIPQYGEGLRRGWFEFRRGTKDAVDGIDQEASDAGRSLGGIYGAPAAQALTPDNQIAELYDPAAFCKHWKSPSKWKTLTRRFKRFLTAIQRILLQIRHHR